MDASESEAVSVKRLFQVFTFTVDNIKEFATGISQ